MELPWKSFLGHSFSERFFKKKEAKTFVVEADGNRLETFYILKWFLKR